MDLKKGEGRLTLLKNHYRFEFGLLIASAREEHLVELMMESINIRDQKREGWNPYMTMWYEKVHNLVTQKAVKVFFLCFMLPVVSQMQHS